MSCFEDKEHRCPICWTTFDSQNALPIVYSCGHSVCRMCDASPNNSNKTCQVCREPITSRVKNSILIETLKALETMCKDVEEHEDPVNNYQCSNCQDWTVDVNMHICKTCIIDEGLLELEEKEQIKKVVQVALCSNCIVPMHALEGHTIVAMFPIWSACNFSIQSSRIHSIWQKFEDGCKLLDQTFADFRALSIEVPENYYLLSDMAQQSQSVVKQAEIFEKMENFIDECISIQRNTENIVRGNNNPVQVARSSKLEEFEIRCYLLDQTISSYKLQWTESTDEYNIFICQASTSDTTKHQKDVFSAMEKLVTGIETLNDQNRSKIENQMRVLQESLTRVKEWCYAEMERLVEDSISTDSNSTSDDDNNK